MEMKIFLLLVQLVFLCSTTLALQYPPTFTLASADVLEYQDAPSYRWRRIELGQERRRDQMFLDGRHYTLLGYVNGTLDRCFYELKKFQPKSYPSSMTRYGDATVGTRQVMIYSKRILGGTTVTYYIDKETMLPVLIINCTRVGGCVSWVATTVSLTVEPMTFELPKNLKCFPIGEEFMTIQE